MRYFANPSTPAVRAAMASGRLGCIQTPGQGNAPVEGAVWAADNGCFSDAYPGDSAWWAWLERNASRAASCAFAVAPDVVGDCWATHVRSMPWLARIRALGCPAAYVLQDNADTPRIPWPHFDVLFIGGSTAFKLGLAARGIVHMARVLGKRVHMGRVNSLRRLRYAAHIGVDTADGTYLAYGPDRNLPRLLSWLDDVNGQRPLFVGHRPRPALAGVR